LDDEDFFPDPDEPPEFTTLMDFFGLLVLVGVVIFIAAIFAARISFLSLTTAFLMSLISSSERGSGTHQKMCPLAWVLVIEPRN
jgi:hypothetical protein